MSGNASGSSVLVVPAPGRKQNIACDSCRAKKVRCLRTRIEDVCEQCQAKSVACTSHYVEALLGKTKRTKRKHRASEAEARDAAAETDRGEGPSSRPISSGHDSSTGKDISVTAVRDQRDDAVVAQNVYGDVDPLRYVFPTVPSLPPPPLRTSSAPQLGVPLVQPPADPAGRQRALLRYLFAPQAVTHHAWGYTDESSVSLCASGQADLWEEMHGELWREEPSAAHRAMTDAQIEALADDLLDTFFSIPHPRFPILDPALFRHRYASPATADPLPHPLLAVVLAWGARFSDHDTIAADRAEVSARDREGKHGRRRSRVVQLLVVRAREVVERGKVHRVVSEENVRTLLLLELLSTQQPSLKERYFPNHLYAASSHIRRLGLTSLRNMQALSEEKQRNATMYLSWMVVIFDAFGAAFYRQQPNIPEADLDLTLPDTSAHLETPAHENLPGSLTWFTAVATCCDIARSIAASLWSPRSATSGIPLASLRGIVHQASDWRDRWLAKQGVPKEFPPDWDFYRVVTAVATDAYYHTLWVIVRRGIDAYGIKEQKEAEAAGTRAFIAAELDGLRKRIAEESEHAALRIAALISVLMLNGYLRLDPSFTHHPIYESGMFLASLGRSECLACVAGLKQYSASFPQFWESAEEIERVYQETIRATMAGAGAGAGGGAHQAQADTINSSDDRDGPTVAGQRSAWPNGGKGGGVAVDTGGPMPAGEVLVTEGGDWPGLDCLSTQPPVSPQAPTTGEDMAMDGNVAQALYDWFYNLPKE